MLGLRSPGRPVPGAARALAGKGGLPCQSQASWPRSHREAVAESRKGPSGCGRARVATQATEAQPGSPGAVFC